MANLESEVNLGASPELFSAGREVMWSFSPDRKTEKEPDYELSEEGRGRLFEAIKNGNEPGGQVVLSRGEPREPRDKMKKPNSWEPFTREPLPKFKLLNFYAGPGEDVLELHRANTEKYIEIAGIDGKVFLKDASLKKRKHQVGKVPYGWQIEIDGEKIQEGLKAEGDRRPVGEQFAIEFEKSLRKSLINILIRENLGLDSKGINAYVTTFFMPLLVSAGISLSEGIESGYTALQYMAILNYVALNILSRVVGQPLGVEANRVARGLLFINHKGRDLVRLCSD